MYQESSHGVKKKMVLFEYNQVSISIYYQTVCSPFLPDGFVCLFVFIYFLCHLQALVQWSLRFLSISTSCLHPHSSTETSTPGTVFCSLSWSIYRTLVLFYSRAVKAPFLSCLLQESGDSVGLRGLKITSGTNL